MLEPSKIRKKTKQELCKMNGSMPPTSNQSLHLAGVGWRNYKQSCKFIASCTSTGCLQSFLLFMVIDLLRLVPNKFIPIAGFHGFFSGVRSVCSGFLYGFRWLLVGFSWVFAAFFMCCLGGFGGFSFVF